MFFDNNRVDDSEPKPEEQVSEIPEIGDSIC